MPERALGGVARSGVGTEDPGACVDRGEGIRFDLGDEGLDRLGGRLGRLEGDRVPRVRQLDEPRTGDVAGELASVLDRKSVV
jgi:hypothetical protein